MLVVFITLNIIQAIVLCFVIWTLWRVIQHNFLLNDRQDEVAEDIEKSLIQLKFLEERFENKSKMDLFLDEPIIREVMSDISATKELLNNISNTLESSLEDEEEDNKDA